MFHEIILKLNLIKSTKYFKNSCLTKKIINTCYSTSTQLPQFTKDKYDIKRGNFNTVNQSHIEYFKNLLGETRVLTDPNELLSYNIDWIKNVRGNSTVVLKPKTSEEVSKILSFCNNEKLAVCPQGGNTGLVGGSVPVFDEIVVSTSAMNKIINVDTTSGVLVCEAGCVLEQLDLHLREKGLMMPLDLGAKGSCQIGGNISTNAGGIRLLRYGNLHGTVLGLEAVKADGEIIDCLSTLKKDNTGYHLKHLFIGSEGTLGLVTKVAIQCPPNPKAVNVAFLGLESFEKVLEAYKKTKSNLGEILSSCELMDYKSLEVVCQKLSLPMPIEEYPFYMLIETSGSDVEHDEVKLNSLMETLLDTNTIKNGIVTNEISKINQIWNYRERITDGMTTEGYVYKYDISIPIEHFYSIVPIISQRLGSDALRVIGYGHLGDSNLHLNISATEFSRETLKKIEPFVFEYVSNLKGSISSEHGIGFRKTKYLHYSKSPSAINLMKQLKKMMDPNGILNPYKVINTTLE